MGPLPASSDWKIAPTGCSSSFTRYTNGSVIPPNFQPNTPLQKAFARSVSAEGSSKCTIVAMSGSLPRGPQEPGGRPVLLGLGRVGWSASDVPDDASPSRYRQ